MNSRPVTSRRRVASRTTSAAASAVCDPTSVGSHAAANDDAARTAFETFFKDPLWVIAIGMGIFFGVTALILALG